MNVMIHDLEKEQFENRPFVVGENTFSLSAYFYGKDMAAKTLETAQALVKANYRNSLF